MQEHPTHLNIDDRTMDWDLPASDWPFSCMGCDEGPHVSSISNHNPLCPLWDPFNTCSDEADAMKILGAIGIGPKQAMTY